MNYSGDVLEVFITMDYVIVSFSFLFASCDFGQRLNQAFEECGEMVDQFSWYLFPVKVQRMLPIIMIYTQKPVFIACFGSISADRETFRCVSASDLIEQSFY